MRAIAVLRGLGPIDVANVRRDSLLRWMILLPPLFGLLIRYLLPVASTWLAGRFEVDLALYLPLVASTLVLMTPMIYGVVIGFLLLDQKDDRTLTALRVTPLSASGYFAYRISIPMVLSIVMTPVALALSGVCSLGLGGRIAAGLAAAPLAPAFALFIGAFARNKVEGFALMKAAGIINWPPLIAWFVDPPAQLLFGLAPTYWPAKVYWQLVEGSGWAAVSLAVGVAYMALLVVWFERRFERVTSR